MKKKIVMLALCVVMISGCGKKIPTLSNGDEAVVELKDGVKISANELYSEMKENYALQSLLNMIDTQILNEKYSDKLDEANDYADSTIEQLEQYYGDDLLNAIQYYTNFSTVEAYKESMYLTYLQNLAIEDYAKEQITEKEIKKYYKDEVVGDIKVNHILITPEVKDDATAEDKTAAEEEAKAKAEEVINKLKKASNKEEEFEKLAKEYSMDETTKENGGSLGYINKGTLGDSYKELEEAAFKLKDGEYSTEIITTELGYHVIIRLETKEKDSLENLTDSIKETLAQKYMTDNPEVQVTALQELRKDYDLDIIDSDLKEQYAKYIQGLLSQYQTESNSSSNASASSN